LKGVSPNIKITEGVPDIDLLVRLKNNIENIKAVVQNTFGFKLAFLYQ